MAFIWYVYNMEAIVKQVLELRYKTQDIMYDSRCNKNLTKVEQFAVIITH